MSSLGTRGRNVRRVGASLVVLVILALAWMLSTAARAWLASLPATTGSPALASSRTPAPALPAAVPASTVRMPVTGQVVDGDTGAPLRGASVSVADLTESSGPSWTEALTDAQGRFAYPAPEPGRTLLVRMPGYAKQRVLPGADLLIRLRPHTVKAAYLTYYGVHDRAIRTRVLDIIEATELNAVVVDVKGDRGLIPYRTAVPLAIEAGAQGPVIIRDMFGLVADLKGRRIYTIARIVAFKDPVLAHHRPDLAIIDTRTGQPWRDREGLAWVDPFREEVWEYILAVAREATTKGFDEVQFDYVRFPTDGRLSAARYARQNTQENRLRTIAGFLGRARRELRPSGVFVAADLFGYTAFNTNDTDIGQRVEEIAPHLDYISTMAYPSGYHLGIPGFRIPVAHPYEIVRESVRLTRQRAAEHPVQVRPWLQDFRDYAFDRRPFGVKEVQAQIRGAEEAGARGWMVWNPLNRYTAEALRPDPERVIRPAAEGR